MSRGGWDFNWKAFWHMTRLYLAACAYAAFSVGLLHLAGVCGLAVSVGALFLGAAVYAGLAIGH